MQQRTLLSATVIFLRFLQLAVSGGNVITVDGDRFQLNGQPYDMWGIRVASASQSQDLTDKLIANLDDYKSCSVNTVAVFVQGSSGGFSDPFSRNGKSIDARHLARIKQIIEACDDRRMVAIIGIFYQRTMANYNNTRKLASSNAVVEAVKTITRALRDHENIIINIANEQNSAKYDQVRGGASRIYDFRDPQKIIDLCRVVRSEDADRLVGGGGYHDENNIVIGRSADVDALLFDSLGPDKDHQSGRHYGHYLANGVRGKPMVNVEMFGGWTARFADSNGEGGYYPQSGKLTHYKEVDDAATRPGLSVFFHSNAWCQGPSDGQPVRYDLGGDGTSTSPGIRWYFEYVRRTIENNKPATDST
ncbi:MAG: cellulase family glycosylhydrolase [Planctomycetota bacterium]|nr:cellulase family glycosylhydrolase [Planctomycetota bacterium]